MANEHRGETAQSKCSENSQETVQGKHPEPNKIQRVSETEMPTPAP